MEAYKDAMRDIGKALQQIQRVADKRNREIVKLYESGMRPARLADRFHISRQRVQQIIARANGK